MKKVRFEKPLKKSSQVLICCERVVAEVDTKKTTRVTYEYNLQNTAGFREELKFSFYLFQSKLKGTISTVLLGMENHHSLLM